MKKYIVTEGSVQSEAEKAGLGTEGLTEPDEGLDSPDASQVAEEAISFDPSTTAWNFPSGDGFLCLLYSGDRPLQTPLPAMVESLDDFADE